MKKHQAILIMAEQGYKLHNKIDNSTCFAIQLPIDADLSVWEEITGEEAEKIRQEIDKTQSEVVE
mgnify:CR=1 FL=1